MLKAREGTSEAARPLASLSTIRTPHSAFKDRAVLLLIFLYLLTLPLMTHDIRAADEIEYFSYLHSIAFDHNLDFLNEYTYFLNRFPDKYSCAPGSPPPPACKKFKET